ncbi:hypothetical protein [Metaclostridioides mangenotii]|uniref:hypothetical protein n=1 Tax=Metaclostridioides mangenotii TaxID=1540 RepID=UPI00046451DF|nr:hypothetical protein [Clostridioides mangenotii]
MTTSFGDYNVSINGLKNAIDDARMQSLGGNLEESLTAQIKIETGKISSEVEKKVDGSKFGSLIEQNYDSVGYAFKTAGGRSNGEYRVVIDNNGLTVNEGAIKTDALIPGTNRRIILEPNKPPGENDCMSIDTNYNGNGAVRLKYNAGTYVYVSSDTITFYINGVAPAKVTSSGFTGVAWNGITGKPSSYNPTSHDHSSATKCAYIYPYNGAGTGEIGNSGKPFDHIEAKRVWWQDSGGHSDIKRKENIIEIQEDPDASKFRTLKAMSVMSSTVKKLNVNNFNSSAKAAININLEDMHNFINKDMKMYHYNYIGANEDKVFFNQIGFIANELAETKVGNVFIEKEQSINEYVFNFSSYTNIIAGALQKEIHKREELEETVNILIEEINHLKGE